MLTINGFFICIHQPLVPEKGFGDFNPFHGMGCFADGTKIKINRDLQINFSGHKWMYCLSFLILSAPDGMIIAAYGPIAGSVNDHSMQHLSQFGTTLLTLQPNHPRYKAGTDKGFRAQICVVPMNNNVVNTAAQGQENTEFSSLRATNEWNVDRPWLLP